jgi:hypothetical protein
LEREEKMAEIRMAKWELRTMLGRHWMPAGRLLTPVLVLLGLILPSANAWAQG